MISLVEPLEANNEARLCSIWLRLARLAWSHQTRLEPSLMAHIPSAQERPASSECLLRRLAVGRSGILECDFAVKLRPNGRHPVGLLGVESRCLVRHIGTAKLCSAKLSFRGDI